MEENIITNYRKIKYSKMYTYCLTRQIISYQIVKQKYVFI